MMDLNGSGIYLVCDYCVSFKDIEWKEDSGLSLEVHLSLRTLCQAGMKPTRCSPLLVYHLLKLLRQYF